MRRSVLWLALVAALSGGNTVRAEIGALDPVPSASLLLPYFEVDLSDPLGNGANTVFTIQNASASAVLVHVTLWTDVGVPTLRHDVYLTGYDVAEVDLHQVLVRGLLTRSASDGQDPTDTITPQGPISQDINFASCTGRLPLPPLTPQEIASLQQFHTGAPATDYQGLCFGRPSGNVARGYVTMDTVSSCSLDVPGDPGYFFPGGSGRATNQNLIHGEYRLEDRLAGTTWGDVLLGLEAAPGSGVFGVQDADPETTLPGQYTFYGYYVNQTAADNREPLGVRWAGRYENDAGSGATTDLIVWRDRGVGIQQPFPCNAPPASQQIAKVVAFDDQESSQQPGAAVSAFPAATQRVRVGSAALPIAFSSGWLFLDLSSTTADPAYGTTRQGAVTLLRQAGPTQTGASGILLESATNESSTLPSFP
jgi:hypothetical protein